MKNKNITTGSFTLLLFPKYAVVTYHTDLLDPNTLKTVRQHLSDYYQNQNFVLINSRKDLVKINPEYYRSGLKNMAGVAIVIENTEHSYPLIEEQSNFDRSFACFSRLEDAESWALNF